MEKLAELVGAILGDGNIFIKENSHYQLRIACHAIDDFDYANYLYSLIEETLNTKPHLNQRGNAIYVSVSRRAAIEFLLSKGLKSGNKILNNQGVPEWVFSSKELMKACLRGIFDTDCCVYPKTKKHKTPSIWLKSAIPQLREDISFIFSELNYSPQKWARTSNEGVLQTCLGKSQEVMRYFNEVKFKNKKHIQRFQAMLL